MFYVDVANAQQTVIFAGTHFTDITNYESDSPSPSLTLGFAREFDFENKYDDPGQSSWYTFRVYVFGIYDRFNEKIQLSETQHARIEYERVAFNAEIENTLLNFDWPFRSEFTTHFGATYHLYFKADTYIETEKYSKNLSLRPLNPYLGLGFNTQFAGNFKIHFSVKQNLLSYFKTTIDETMWDVLAMNQRSFRTFTVGVMYVW